MSACIGLQHTFDSLTEFGLPYVTYERNTQSEMSKANEQPYNKKKEKNPNTTKNKRILRCNLYLRMVGRSFSAQTTHHFNIFHILKYMKPQVSNLFHFRPYSCYRSRNYMGVLEFLWQNSRKHRSELQGYTVTEWTDNRRKSSICVRKQRLFYNKQ